MSKFLIKASIILLITSCTQERSLFAESVITKEDPNPPKKSNLIQVSEFSIVSSNYDTLYLKEGDYMAEVLNESWEDGSFRRDEVGKSTKVILLDEEGFSYISKKSTPSESYYARLSNLSNRH